MVEPTYHTNAALAKKFLKFLKFLKVRERMDSFRSPDKIHLRKLLTDYKDILLARLTST